MASHGQPDQFAGTAGLTALGEAEAPEVPRRLGPHGPVEHGLHDGLRVPRTGHPLRERTVGSRFPVLPGNGGGHSHMERTPERVAPRIWGASLLWLPLLVCVPVVLRCPAYDTSDGSANRSRNRTVLLLACNVRITMLVRKVLRNARMIVRMSSYTGEDMRRAPVCCISRCNAGRRGQPSAHKGADACSDGPDLIPQDLARSFCVFHSVYSSLCRSP